MQIELVGTGCPVLPDVTVGVQRGRDVVDERPASGGELRWVLDVPVRGGELRGPFVQGRPGARFLYLVWSRPPEGMFRRAKLMLDAVPPELLDEAEQPGLRAVLGLAMSDGSPLCAAVRPPAVRWTPREIAP